MKTTTLTILNEEQMLETLTSLMEQKFDDFKPCRDEYLQSLNILKMEVGEEKVNKVLAAFTKRCAAELIFAGSLGFQANLENFRNPVNRTFLDVDFEDYLRKKVMVQMPHYNRAEQELHEFYQSLTEEQKGAYEGISAYMVYFECTLPKLAHYNGFMFANEILPYTEPGYSSNYILTSAYKRFIDKWFGVEVDTVVTSDNETLVP